MNKSKLGPSFNMEANSSSWAPVCMWAGKPSRLEGCHPKCPQGLCWKRTHALLQRKWLERDGLTPPTSSRAHNRAYP